MFERQYADPLKAIALMFATLLEEMHTTGCADKDNIGKVLALEIVSIEDMEQMPPVS